MLKYILLAMLIFSSPVHSGMLDENGQPRLLPYTILDVSRHCSMNGYFVYDSTIYMCVKIRENVSKAELRKYYSADSKRQVKRATAQRKWFKEWIKTDEGKAWDKKYKEKLKLKESKGKQ